MSEVCVWCGRDTSFGSGLFVNRIPATTETVEGYGCQECYEGENV